MKHKYILLLIAGTLLSACAQPPTKTFTTQDIDVLFLEKSLRKPIAVNAETIILDARKPFDFAVTHLPQAVNMQWNELLKDPAQDAVRLSLLGISPKSQVLILGHGLKGTGEEGRLAWALLYLGIFDVQTSEADALGLHYSNLLPPPRKNAERWEPQIQSSILVTKKEVIRLVSGKKDEHTHIIDVRSHNEYFSKNKKLKYELPDLGAVNIEWKQFFTAQGRPNVAIREQLRGIKIGLNDRVIVLCDTGLRSGAVTYALLSLGYKKVANFVGGYNELLDLKKYN